MSDVDPTISILLVDERVVIRKGLRLLLDMEPNLEVVAEADCVDDVTDLHAEPDVTVLHLRRNDIHCTDVIARLRKRLPGSAVLVLTWMSSPSTVQAAMAQGASGYVLQESQPGTVIEAVMRLSRGERYVQPSLAAALTMGTTPHALTCREREVLRLVALGHTNKEIAEILNLSLRTVESHRATISRKLDLRTRAELVQYALRRRIVGLHDRDPT